jgi:hypothetical protein
LFTEVPILGHKSVITKVAKKILKHEEPTTEIQHLWNGKTDVIAVITKNYRRQSAILGTASTMW